MIHLFHSLRVNGGVGERLSPLSRCCVHMWVCSLSNGDTRVLPSNEGWDDEMKLLRRGGRRLCALCVPALTDFPHPHRSTSICRTNVPATLLRNLVRIPPLQAFIRPVSRWAGGGNRTAGGAARRDLDALCGARSALETFRPAAGRMARARSRLWLIARQYQLAANCTVSPCTIINIQCKIPNC